MATKFRSGIDQIKQDAQRKGGKRRFTPSIYWKAGDVRVIAWLTEGNEIPKVRLHQMVRVPDDKFESGFRWETFLCQKDPALIDEYGGECELCDRVGHEAAERYVALALELDTVKEGKKVKELRVKTDEVKKDDGSTATYPRWGLVIQASKNFFSYFAAYTETSGDIRDVAWEIHREGGGTDTKYHPFIVMNGPNAVSLPDLSSTVENIPELEDLLEQMASPEKYEQVATIEAGSQPSFGGSKQSETGVVPSGDRETEFAKMKEEVVGAY